MQRFICKVTSRGYELDARERVSPGTLARYMEHARWQAISSGALGLKEMFAAGYRIVVRAQDLRIGAPLMHDTELAVSVAIARVGGSSFTLAQWVHRRADGAELASSLVTGVVIDETGRPTRAPDSLRRHNERLEVDPITGFVDEPGAGTFRRRVGVRASDLDTLQHVNQSRYIDYIDDTRVAAIHRGALPGDPHATPHRIVVDYQRETKLGHELVAMLWALDDSGRTLACLVRNARTRELVARARLEA